MVRVGIVGTNFGRLVHLPAFRADARCDVVALAGTDAARTATLAREAGVAKGYGGWEALVDDPDVEAVAIATLPALQPAIAIRALERGKPVFIDKPMAADVAQARAMLVQARRTKKPTMIDFEFLEVPAWKRAREIVASGALGALRHVAVNWQVENRAVMLRMRNWKTASNDGGGVLGSFISHSFHYLEWLCGPIDALSTRMSGISAEGGAKERDKERDMETDAAIALQFASGANGTLAMSCASFLGSGHAVELYGEDGTLILHNPTRDYMRGFTLRHARRPAEALVEIPTADPSDTHGDGRIAPVGRLVSRFIDAIESGAGEGTAFDEGYRVQTLIDAARRAHNTGVWVDTRAQTLDAA
ncbi:MAG: Gfo/Idh/MocA family oxidoreductase [Pseudolabrys sp.]|nr:Gfo/Idh/MocA family oxidoreductase [Pseudolabrys sp.]